MQPSARSGRLLLPDPATAMADKYRAPGPAQLAREEARRLAAAIMEETKRLFRLAVQDAMRQRG